jgi:hypothetical protein
MMDVIILGLFAFVRILLQHPKRSIWLNITFFFLAVGCLMDFFPDDNTLTIVLGAAVTVLVHFCGKSHYNRKSAKKAAATPAPAQTVPQRVTPPVQTPPTRPATPPQPVRTVPTPQPEPVAQTLTTCVRCGQPLRGPVCAHCQFDHIANPIFLLCRVPSQKMQIDLRHTQNSR